VEAVAATPPLLLEVLGLDFPEHSWLKEQAVAAARRARNIWEVMARILANLAAAAAAATLVAVVAQIKFQGETRMEEAAAAQAL
jgi:hypothetical protein